MKKIIECVPNFSEGRDKRKINLIVQAVKKVRGVKLLNVDADPDYNRTVISFAGGPEEIKEASFAAIAKACELIDMSCHKGVHPRLGACDVCPFVPIHNFTMEECVGLAKEVGKMVGELLRIPVYFYEEAASRPERKNLADIRKGEYEGLEEKLKNPEWQPDCGPAFFDRKSGAIVIGARQPLIAFNINLETDDKEAADIIAKVIRESGWLFGWGEKRVRIPGVLKGVKAIGIFLKEYGIWQVSMNLTNFKMTPPHVVFETVKRLTPGLAKVKGSEIVGLVPKEAILMAGSFYAPKEKSEKKLIETAVKNLGLNSLREFSPKKKIIEYLIS